MDAGVRENLKSKLPTALRAGIGAGDAVASKGILKSPLTKCKTLLES